MMTYFGAVIDEIRVLIKTTSLGLVKFRIVSQVIYSIKGYFYLQNDLDSSDPA